mgnify:CR=1 FL=1
MKSKTLLAVLLALSGTLSLPSEARNAAAPRSQPMATVPAPLAAEEIADLLWMREEEKLARDVYLALYAIWQQPEFQRIATSEQRHFDAIGARLSQFGLADPALPAQGEFSQLALQTLYQEMLDNGRQGYVQALTVGAGIEDLDIADLMAAIDETTNLALKRTYAHLLEGSKNHLRAFVYLLRDQGADYTPYYIEPVLFDAIVGD